jgi:hypothetical protein
MWMKPSRICTDFCVWHVSRQVFFQLHNVLFLAEQQIIATIIAVIMESTSQHELSLCSGFFNAQYYIRSIVRSSSDY